MTDGLTDRSDGLTEEMQFEANETDAMLMQAAADGDCARLQKLIDDGACVYYREPGTGRTALHAAAEHGRREAIELLLENHHPWFVHYVLISVAFLISSSSAGGEIIKQERSGRCRCFGSRVCTACRVPGPVRLYGP